jgi:hypothetical protein
MVLPAVQMSNDPRGIARHRGAEDCRVVGEERVAELVSPFDGH